MLYRLYLKALRLSAHASGLALRNVLPCVDMAERGCLGHHYWPRPYLRVTLNLSCLGLDLDGAMIAPASNG